MWDLCNLTWDRKERMGGRLLVTTKNIVGHFQHCSFTNSLFFAAVSCSLGLLCMLLLIAPGLSLSISLRLQLPLIHSQDETHSGIVVCKQGFFPTRGSGLCSNTCIWHEKKMILFLWLTQTFYVLIFQGLITLLCAKVGFLFHCPEQSTVAACREKQLMQQSFLIHQWRKHGRVDPRLHPHHILYCLFLVFSPLLSLSV